jgi:predicted Zn-dependent protease
MSGYSGGGGWNERLLQLLAALLFAVVTIGAIVIQGYQKGPFGRGQIVALSPAEEKQLGAQAFAEVLKKERDNVIESGPIVNDVKRVTERLVRATKNPDFLAATRLKPRDYQWEVDVIRSRQVNAFCLPGGKMVVYTAILPICQTDAGLATVMGHEIGHALASHGAERMSQQKIAQIIVASGGASLGDMSPQQRDQVMRALNAGAQFGILHYSRRQESEADHIGLLLMATAGYNPREAIKFWERMSKMAGGGHTPEFLSTHPSHETRIRDLENWLPQALSLYKASGHSEPPEKLHLADGG